MLGTGRLFSAETMLNSDWLEVLNEKLQAAYDRGYRDGVQQEVDLYKAIGETHGAEFLLAFVLDRERIIREQGVDAAMKHRSRVQIDLNKS